MVIIDWGEAADNYNPKPHSERLKHWEPCATWNGDKNNIGCHTCIHSLSHRPGAHDGCEFVDCRSK